MPIRAVIYARYSSENQRDASTEDQIELGRRYIGRQDWTLINTYADRALSGGSRMRPGFLQMLADAEAGRFEVVVCESVDRLG
jgi:site-specific DNA recombinase